MCVTRRGAADTVAAAARASRRRMETRAVMVMRIVMVMVRMAGGFWRRRTL